MKENYIDVLLAHFLLGTITEEEKNILDSWEAENDEHRKMMEDLRKYPFLTSDYNKYASIDTNKAWRTFKQKTHVRRNIIFLRPYITAAAIALLLIISGIIVLWYQNYTRITPPVLSSNVMAAIEKSIESGYADNMLTNNTENATTVERGEDISKEELEVYQLDIDVIDEMLENNHIETLRSHESWLRLDDGTIVHMSANSRIIYPEHFKKATLFNPNVKREVIVDGEAYFMVAHDNRRQFVVHTRHGDIVDYGTEFFVATSDKSTKVALVEGSIGFTAQEGKEMILKPGEEATVVGSDVSVTDKNMNEYRAWNTGMFFFEDEKLESIAHVIKRWSSMNITFADDEVRSLHVSGSFDRYNAVEDLIDAICDVMGLQWARKDEDTIIISR